MQGRNYKWEKREICTRGFFLSFWRNRDDSEEQELMEKL